ncbi:MAG: hypothetical protein E3J83_05275 [Candidatus Atribacteria bacterium]|nr:MAG: hypothetical protein E3J83_05275 [Candidatus Atribacteria bacterium]
MTRKTVNFNLEGIKKLPNDKPVVYKILTKNNNNNYTGIAKKGRVLDRLMEHLSKGKDPIPGDKIQIEQMSSIKEAQTKEKNILSRSNPRYNKK